MTLYLLDANVFIRADADYYPLDRIPGFWAWLHGMADAGKIKTPLEIYDEVAKSSDQLGQWLRQPDIRKAIILPEPTNPATVEQVISQGYAPDLNDIEFEAIGRDPFLVAAALHGPNRFVVTREVSKPSKQRQNRKVPDICDGFRVPWINDFELWRRLDFRI
ncbi:DUF4411 family protein [Roseomonas aerophila]|uniref:DUF4411 family protein n=1 Tax=Teichococcus aerophilus TaxID=1224513 RepID=A0ABR7RU73_9PROT|nr:DUF4411 family protein [Pseudoroseomonas aerophila]MBC9209587.1 DUF4411 family protein [Pseudoroseomonas aerophila]